MSDKKITFEENIIRLEQIISSLEKGEVSLDECIALFEEGVKISKDCMYMLDNAEQKIKILTQNDDSVTESDFVIENE